MSDSEQVRRRRFIGVASLASAGLLALVAALAYTGVLPLPPETRGTAAMVMGAAAMLDVLVGFWFLRLPQSS
jgi:hypothetical protein